MMPSQRVNGVQDMLVEGSSAGMNNNAHWRITMIHLYFLKL